MPRKRVIIEISATSLEGAIVSGARVVRSARVEVDPEALQKAWEAGFEPLDRPLQALVHRLEAKGMVADVCYASPTCVVEVISVPARSSAAWGAARLALADIVAFDLLTHPWAVHPLATDEAGEPRRSHMLAAADEASRPLALAALLERAQMRPGSFAPSAGATLVRAVEAVRSHKGDGPLAALCIDGHASALAVGANGRIRFVRRMDIGVETIVDALTNPMVRLGEDDKPLSLSREEARKALFTIGVPTYREVLDERRGLTGRDALPLIQPVLQRLVVETKQSLRFELSAAEREATTLLVCGPGAGAPRLDEVLSGQAEIDLAERPERGPCDAFAPFHGDGERGATLSRLAREVALIPEVMLDGRRRTAVARGMWAGAGVAAAMFVAGATATLLATQSAERQARRHSAVVRQADALERSRDLSSAFGAALAATEARIASAVGQGPSWPAWMAEFARMTSDSIQVDAHQAARGQNGFTVELNGAARSVDGESARAELTRFIERLRASPLVAAVDLGATRRTDSDGVEEQRFRVTLTLTPLPRSVAAAKEGSP